MCPEIEIKLGIPRERINLIKGANQNFLYQSNNNKNLNNEMKKFSLKFLKKINYKDGIILKSKSPTCGINTAKIYSNKNLNKLYKKGTGLFAHNVIEKFPNIPKYEESELDDPKLKDHFYECIFIISDFRKINSIKNLYDFHSKHKLLFMSRNQLDLKKLGRIAANNKKNLINQILKDYFDYLLIVLQKKATNGTHINALTHAFGYYKKQLKNKEKKDFLNLIEEYRINNISINIIFEIINIWNKKFENEYLLNQSYFEPYPKELI